MILFKTIKSPYVHKWRDFEKTTSYIDGARWNTPKSSIMYLSSNVQNAMLEVSNYSPNPKMVNRYYHVAVFEFPSLRLHTIEPKELPSSWNWSSHPTTVQKLGMKYLDDHENYDGIMVPSATINPSIATHSINTIRHPVYANVVVNLETISLDNIKLVDSYSPVYSNRMFLPKK
jgi:RES domain-containing protein